MPAHPLEEILHPRSIAITGASKNPAVAGYYFTHHLLNYGYQGRIYPVNPNYQEVLGLKAYPTLKDIPGTVDYVISCVPAGEVLNILADCPPKGVKAVHLYTARFSETGRPEAAEAEQAILKTARRLGIRLIGPNCMGLYYPREGISFGYDFPQEPGSVGLISQTGGGATTFIHMVSLRGIRFSKAISYGNALDLNESDFLDYFSQDPETKIILMYIEGVKDGRRFFNALRQAATIKPIIITKGGRGEAGARAIASHTASLASHQQTWKSLVHQAGAISAQNFDEMADLAVSFYFLPPIPGPRVGVVGGGGGISVTSADECETAGLEVIPLPPEIREELKSKAPTLWDWLSNPTDTSITGGSGFTSLDMLEMMARNQNFDLLIANLPEGAPPGKDVIIPRMRNEVKGHIKIKKQNDKPLMVVVSERSLNTREHHHWRWQELNRVRTKLLAANIPSYPSIGRAARAARKMIDYYQRRR